MLVKSNWYKKYSCFLLLFLLIGGYSFFFNTTFAATTTLSNTIEQKGMTFTILENPGEDMNGKLALMSVKEEASQDGHSFIIPSHLLLNDGTEYDVIAIHQGAFSQILELQNIVIPSSVTVLEKNCLTPESSIGVMEESEKDSSVVIYANAGSSADTFAKENEIALITEGVKFNQEGGTSLSIGEKKTITITCPDFFDKDATINWSSEDEKIASIDTGGIVSALSLGKTTIWAECEGLKNSFEVEVKETSESESEVSTMALESVVYSDIKDGGIYNIISSLNSNMVMDIYAASKDNGANVQLWSYNGTDAQRFKAQKNNDETWTFINIGSNKVMDIAANENRNGANIQQYSSNSTDAQKWKVVDNSDGTVTFLNVNGKVIDVNAAQTNPGANIQLYQRNDSKAQRFILKLNNSYSGIYTFRSTLNQSKVLDITAGLSANGTNAQLYDTNGSNAQKFSVEGIGNGYYRITNMKSGKALDVAGAGKGNGTNIQQYEWNGTAAQKWKIQDNADGSVTLSSMCNGLAMDVASGYTYNGNNIWCYQSNGSKAQKWIMEPVSYTPDYSITSGATGVDVSYWNGYNNNWNSAKSAGVQFAILRTGWGRSGDGEKDSTFEGNYSRAKAAGIPVGTYQYSYATSVAEAKAEAKFVLSILNGRALDLPVAFDIEDASQSGLSKTELTNITIAFCDTIKAGGYTPMVYANLNWFTNKLDYDRLSSYKIWLAQYNDQPTFNKSFDIWQYSSKGQIPGLGGLIDMNRAYTNL